MRTFISDSADMKRKCMWTKIGRYLLRYFLHRRILHIILLLQTIDLYLYIFALVILQEHHIVYIWLLILAQKIIIA